MATLTVQQITRTGAETTFVAADVAGDTFANEGSRTFLEVNNASGGNRVVTIDSVKNCDQGFDHNIVVTIPTLEIWKIGPFGVDRFGANPTVTYDAVTSTTVAVVRI